MAFRRRDLAILLMLPTIVEYRSLNKAAQRLGTSQSALTRSIMLLERSIGAKLLDRSRRGVTLTPIGEALLTSAQTLAAELRHVSAEIEILRGTSGGGTVRVGTTTHMAGFLLPSVISMFASRHSNVVVRLIEDSRASLLAQLRLGELDIVLGASYEVPEPEIIEEPIYPVEMQVLVNAEHPLARMRKLSLRDLVKYPWVLPGSEGSLYRQIGEEFRSHGVPMVGPSAQISSLPTVTALLAESKRHVAVFPLDVVHQEINSGRIVAITGDWSFRRRWFSLFLRQRVTSSPTLLAFIRYLKEQASSVAAQGQRSVNKRRKVRLPRKAR